MNLDKKRKELSYAGRAKFYWLIWISIILCSVIVKSIFTGIEAFHLLGLYLFLTWLPSGGVYFIEIDRLMEHLRMFHVDEWNTFRNKLPYGRKYKGFKLLLFIWSSKNLNDDKVSFLKKECRLTWLLPIAVFITFPVIGTMLLK